MTARARWACAIALVLATSGCRRSEDPERLAKEIERATMAAMVADKPAARAPPKTASAPFRISVLVRVDGHWIGTSADEQRCLPAGAKSYDWDGLEQHLGALKADLPMGREIEIAALDDVIFQDLVTTMDSAITKGFDDVSLVSPEELSVATWKNGCPAPSAR